MTRKDYTIIADIIIDQYRENLKLPQPLGLYELARPALLKLPETGSFNPDKFLDYLNKRTHAIPPHLLK